MKKITSLVKSSFRTIVAAVALTFATGLTAQNVTLTALSGTPGYANEDFDALVDGKPETKWCVGSFEEAYIVFVFLVFLALNNHSSPRLAVYNDLLTVLFRFRVKRYRRLINDSH